MAAVQKWIHKLELGPWFRYLKISLACLTLVLLTLGYNWRSFRNMSAPEAMDAAQVARNLAEGKGYSTLFVRPFSLYLVQKRNEARFGVAPPDQRADYARIKDRHPDLANPPVYPCVLAGLMKVMPFKYAVDTTNPFWSIPVARQSPGNARQFWRYEPDFLISLFNELLLFAVIALTYFLARRLFDAKVAWLSALLLLGCELLWRFSVSGLSTMLLLLIFMGLAWCLMFIEREAREPKWGPRGLLLLAAGAGLLVGVGALTRYSFGWLIIPVMVFLVFFSGPRKAVLSGVALAAFVVALAPWVYRNWVVSGTPFGTASFAVVEGTFVFPGNQLERSLSPDFSGNFLTPFLHKLLANTRQILQGDLPRLGGSWVTAFFGVGLLLAFRNPAIRRLRYFLVISLATLVVVQALGRTELSEGSPDINSGNLLVLLVPLVVVYGVSLFFLLRDQMRLRHRAMHHLATGSFAGVMCLPMICTFLPPRPTPVAYPPCYPPAIQQTAGWMRENELMMSDVPWAVAWYGKRQCLWLTLNAQADFFAVNDLLKPVRGLYLTPETMDGKFVTQWVRAGEYSWGNFILGSVLRHEYPPNFPLRIAPTGFLPEQLFLTDWERWKITPAVQAAPDK